MHCATKSFVASGKAPKISTKAGITYDRCVIMWLGLLKYRLRTIADKHETEIDG